MDANQGGGPDVWDYAWMTALSFAGAFLRSQRWLGPDGKIVWLRVISELFTAIAMGAVVIAVGDKYQLDRPIVGGLAGFAGFVGPAALIEPLPAIIKAKFGIGIGGVNVSDDGKSK